ncbi:MAG: hypothetical protein ACHQIG_02540 [Acidimicrobiia bacterium]
MLRIAWITLPVTAGAAMSSALGAWSSAPRAVAETLLWLAWAVGLLAVLAPRPPTLTALRVIAPSFVVAAILVAIGGDASTTSVVAAIAATILTLALASGHDIALAAANAGAYGDEQRFLLRTPPALFLAPIPVARLLMAAALVVPPLLLADQQWVLGVVTLAVAVPVVTVLARALNALSRRWAVLVPAGLVLVDPLTLTDPVLFLRERVAGLEPAEAGAAPDGVLDLRLGAAAGSVSARFTEPAELQRSAPGRRSAAATVTTSALWFAVARRDEFLALASTRRTRAG